MLKRFRTPDPNLDAAAALAPGTEAPNFTLPATTGRAISLREFRGQPIVLVFYPADWSPVCGDQLALYNEVLPLFRDYSAQVLGISVDGIWCHHAFAENRKLQFPLMADFEPKGVVTRAYGVYDENAGQAKRALFVVDAKGIIRWSYVSPVDVNPGANGILEALEAFNS